MTHHTDGEERYRLCGIGLGMEVEGVSGGGHIGRVIGLMADPSVIIETPGGRTVTYSVHAVKPTVEAAPHGKQTKQKTKDDAQGA